jgi:hypothetical protein
VQDAWLPELLRVVGTINTAFGIAFRDIGCVGEVALDQGNGEDYDKFAVQASTRRAPNPGCERSGQARVRARALQLSA